MQLFRKPAKRQNYSPEPWISCASGERFSCPMSSMTHIFVVFIATKRDCACQGRELYVSPWFKKASVRRRDSKRREWQMVGPKREIRPCSIP
jgi:hypothetical protein